MERFKMSLTKVFCVILLTTMPYAETRSEDHVCTRMENYTVTSMEMYTEPVIVNTFMWCLQIPPRCPRTRTEMRQRYRMKTEVKNRSVKECCVGYKKLMVNTIHDDIETVIRCVPFCENCLAGVCVSPNQCQCDPGYRGDDCAHECLPGSWGMRCMQECDCGRNVTCNPINGTCRCPAGLRGAKCELPCSKDRWGAECENHCNCDTQEICDPVNGKCLGDDEESVERSLNGTHNHGGVLVFQEPAPAAEHGEVDRLPETSGEIVEGTIDYTEVSATIDYTAVTFHETTPTIPPYSDNKTKDQEKHSSTTTRPMIVLVSVPERRKNLDVDRSKFTIKNTFLRHVEDGGDLRRVPPKTEYVKTIHKEDASPAPIPLDIALIVVASIVSLGLTSIAVVMVAHMRSKQFETVRLSIYDDEKSKKRQDRENTNSERISAIVATSPPPSIPQATLRVNPVFATESGAILTLDGVETNNYANGAATIDLRISGNLRDFFQDHYDRPPATLTRLQANLENDTEHVYDEIPLQLTPLCSRKAT